MLKKITIFIAFACLAVCASTGLVHADDNPSPQNQPTCAQRVFAAALLDTSDMVDESDPEYIIKDWIYTVFRKPDVLRAVLQCPEIIDMDEEDTIAFPPVGFRFPGGREIVIDYTTQPKILRQRVLISDKRELPNTGPTARVGANDGSTWSNTEPAWYGIMIVQAGTMDEYVGDDKNNTISINWLATDENWHKFYPANHNTTKWWQVGGIVTTPKCTSTSALADDGDIVNIAVHLTTGETVSFWKGNDYFVYGDTNLSWITWSQVALDVVITVATIGGGSAILGGLKGTRALRATKGLRTTMSNLLKFDNVREYEKAARTLRKTETSIDALRRADRAGNAANIARLEEEARALRSATTALERADTAGNIKKFKAADEAFTNVLKAARSMKFGKLPQTGNVVARSVRPVTASLRYARAVRGGNKAIGGGAKIARAGMSTTSGKVRDWLFHSTAKFGGALGKNIQTGGALYGAFRFIGNMYDWSETETGDFTSGLNFKPLLLLGGDNFRGQENVVSHGMWIMFAGDSLSPADDDAAYLQAIDFAEKFYEDMEDVQEAVAGVRHPSTMCDVDIYVVRPIIRNPDSDNPEIFYLIMNDEPWRVRQ
ncbi:MAG: hypothetical protein FWE52_00475 [Alphaproteobacteria bacterium]|nr:hypothetical protein [Alphaproteobacteria bacterium]